MYYCVLQIIVPVSRHLLPVGTMAAQRSLEFLADARKKSVAARKNLTIDAETAYQAVTLRRQGSAAAELRQAAMLMHQSIVQECLSLVTLIG
jgi:hypothetical protein